MFNGLERQYEFAKTIGLPPPLNSLIPIVFPRIKRALIGQR